MDGEYDHVPGVSIYRETNLLAIGDDTSRRNGSLISHFDVPRVFIEPVDCSKNGNYTVRILGVFKRLIECGVARDERNKLLLENYETQKDS